MAVKALKFMDKRGDGDLPEGVDTDDLWDDERNRARMSQ